MWSFLVPVALFITMASEDAYTHSLNEVEAAATGDPAATKETSGDESSESSQFQCFYDSKDRLVKMEKQEKKRKKKKSSPIRWAKGRDSGSSETWESNPEAEDEFPLHKVTIRKMHRQLDQIRREFMTSYYQIAELPLDDVRIAKLQKEVDKILKGVKKLEDEIFFLL